ncbi:MAG: plasmid pRiA4b ORF-3 family protein [Phycisphaerae bacterium]|nr:plasmid pRiA4b ORF-3 family protein [Phycisphaerae bacterium]
MPPANPPDTAYTLKITLTESKPTIWRRFYVPRQITLDRLHDVIQIVMGWDEKHLHCFTINGQRYTETPEDMEMEGQEEGDFKLCDVVPRVGMSFSYKYDFGDGWEHTLDAEDIKPVPEGHSACVACFGGERSCPPEDVGGMDGFREFLAAIVQPEHPRHKRNRRWVGRQFDPEGFHLKAINLELGKYARWSRPRLVDQELFVGEF